MADRIDRYADAIKVKDRQLMDRAGREMEEYALTAVERIIAETEKLGGDTSKMREQASRLKAAYRGD